MPLEPADWKAINNVLHRLYKELDSKKHSRLMLEVLHELVPGDSLALNIVTQVDPYKMEAVTLPENHSTPEQLGLIVKYSRQSPFASYYLSTVDATWKTITDFIPEEEFHRTELYRLALSPIGVRHQIFGALGFIDGVGYGIAINRTHNGFTEREREMLNIMQPHLVTSLINAAVCSRAQNSISQITAAMDSAPGAYGFFDAAGKLTWLQERARVWLREFFANEIRNQAADDVPPSVQRLLRDSIQKGRIPQQVEKTSGQERLTVCLGASPIGGWIMRLDRKPVTPPLHFLPLPQLSKRRNEVLRWMTEGKRNAEIAVILNLSTRTVENHVQAILKKLDVETRSSASFTAMEYCVAVNLGMHASAAPAS